jgi:erythromycin esterase-like protein
MAWGLWGEINLGQLAREEWGQEAVLIGFGTDRGNGYAATAWDGAPETMEVNPPFPRVGGRLMREAGPERFLPRPAGGRGTSDGSLGRGAD